MARKLKQSKPKPYDSLQDLIDAMKSLAELVPEDDGAATAKEISRAVKWSEAMTYEWLHALKAEGRLECTKVVREQLDGSRRRMSAYKVRA